jgi:hypothetical protein
MAPDHVNMGRRMSTWPDHVNMAFHHVNIAVHVNMAKTHVNLPGHVSIARAVRGRGPGFSPLPGFREDALRSLDSDFS